MLTIAVILIVLWLLGLVTSYTLGGLIHIMRTIARYFSFILIVGILLGSAGCYLERAHDRHGQRDDRNYRMDRDDHRERNNRGQRDNRGNRDNHKDSDDRR